MARTGRSIPSHTIQGDMAPFKTFTVIPYANPLNTRAIVIEPKTGAREREVHLNTGIREI